MTAGVGTGTGRAGAEKGCELIRRRQRPPDEAKGEINREIGEVRVHEFGGQLAGYNETFHVPHQLKARSERGSRGPSATGGRWSIRSHPTNGGSDCTG